MRKITTAILMIAMFVLLVPASAQADRTNCPERVDNTYSGLYHAVAKKHGKRTPGRNIRRQGVQTKHGVRDARCGEVTRSIRTFRRWLAPPIPAPMPSDRIPATAATAHPTQAGGKWAIPAYIVQCESGGNYNARNPSGAYGAYQIMPGTAAGYGCSLATPAGQDACAAKIYAAEGAAPWSCG